MGRGRALRYHRAKRCELSGLSGASHRTTRHVERNGLKFKHAMLSIFIGILIAGIIVTCLSLLGRTGAVIAGIGLSSLAVFGLWKT